MDPKENTQMTDDALHDLVVESDTGARSPAGATSYIIFSAALFWALFQLWIASPLPFLLGDACHALEIARDTCSTINNIFVLNETKARYIHLALALFIGFLAYPAFRNSPRRYIPVTDWVFAICGVWSTLYLLTFYETLSMRSGIPHNIIGEIQDGTFIYEGIGALVKKIFYDDIIISIIGICVLLEATRRALGPPLMIIGIIFLIYTFAGSADWIPEVIRHKGQSLEKVANHMWLTTEGVFGIALGVSTSFVFLFVLFGALLDKAGAGHYFIQVAFSLLGHLRGGPAKAAVLSSALTGLVSGSSIANVVTTGTFTVPLMRRVGFSKEKAGAVEVASSVNGQIMPPVMGAAAFLMVEYVGIPYTDVVKHAFLPALISYIALIYIVHLEALKTDMPTLQKPRSRTWLQAGLSFGIVSTSIIMLSWVIYHATSWIKDVFQDNAVWYISSLIAVAYFGLLAYQSRYPELESNDDESNILPEVGPTVKSGLHYILPIVVLVWCLMVERLSPGLSAFWATSLIVFILITQRPIKAFFRKTYNYSDAAKAGFNDLIDGLTAGARNMVGIGVATAAAGVVVGAVSLTGVGQVLTEVVEIISGGSLILILIFTAIICLILGMGLPTTANYIVVASLMASVIQDLGAQNGLIIPAIAVHLFVFYFGIMADVTPPVGLASFAAAAVSGGDPIRTGFQAFFYSIRTVILPFFFIFNTNLLLIGVDSIAVGVLIFINATIAILLFAAATQGYFLVKSKLFESAILLLIAFTLFVPKFWIDQIVSPFASLPASNIDDVFTKADKGDVVRLIIQGKNQVGGDKEIITTHFINKQQSAQAHLQSYGLTLRNDGDQVLVDNVMFNSTAQKIGVDIDLAMDYEFDYIVTAVQLPQAQPNEYLTYIPASILFIFVVFLQRRRAPQKQLKHNTTARTAAI